MTTENWKNIDFASKMKGFSVHFRQSISSLGPEGNGGLTTMLDTITTPAHASSGDSRPSRVVTGSKGGPSFFGLA
jgi:hypothetical protein